MPAFDNRECFEGGGGCLRASVDGEATEKVGATPSYTYAYNPFVLVIVCYFDTVGCKV